MSPRVTILGPPAHAPGGISQFTQRLGEALARRADVGIVGLSRLYPSWSTPGRNGHSGNHARVPERIVRTTAWEPWTWRRARREIDETAPDILVVQWWHPAFGPITRSLSRSAKRAGARIVVVCHNAIPHEPFPLARRLTASGLRHADHVVTMSDTVTSQVRALASHAEIVELEHPPNLPLCSERAPRDPGAPPRLLFFGNIRPYKGLADLLEAMPAVRAVTPVRLVVAGRFMTSEARFRREVERLGLQADVEIRPGYVPDDEVQPLLASVDLLVLPYRSASQSGIVALAAMTGTPVVATTAGGIPGALGRDARLVPPGDSRALAAAIVGALRSPPPPPPVPRTGWDEWGRTLLGLIEPSPAAAPV